MTRQLIRETNSFQQLPNQFRHPLWVLSISSLRQRTSIRCAIIGDSPVAFSVGIRTLLTEVSATPHSSRPFCPRIFSSELNHPRCSFIHPDPSGVFATGWRGAPAFPPLSSSGRWRATRDQERAARGLALIYLERFRMFNNPSSGLRVPERQVVVAWPTFKETLGGVGRHLQLDIGLRKTKSQGKSRRVQETGDSTKHACVPGFLLNGRWVEPRDFFLSFFFPIAFADWETGKRTATWSDNRSSIRYPIPVVDSLMIPVNASWYPRYPFEVRSWRLYFLRWRS
jgi:hypothetical protein